MAATSALVVDPTGLEDAEDAFAAVIARPANARTALAVRAPLAGDPVVTVPATGPEVPATTATAASSPPVAAAGLDGAAAAVSTPASAPIPCAPSEEPAVVGDDDLVARMARRLSQVETRRPPRRARSR